MQVTLNRWYGLVGVVVLAGAAFVLTRPLTTGKNVDSDLVKFSQMDCRVVRGILSSQEPRGTQKYKELENKYVEFSNPGSEHDHLKVFEGKWNTKATITDIAGKSKEAEAISTIKWILGNRFLAEEFEEKTSDFRGHGMMGYDKGTKKYFMFWIDTMSPEYFLSEGTSDEHGKVFTLKGEAVDHCTGAKISYTQTFTVESEDKIVYVMQLTNHGNKKEYKPMEIVYTRAK